MLRFDCPNCGKRLKMAPEAVVKPAKCPGCGISIAPQVRAPEEPEPEFVMPDPVPVAHHPVHDARFSLTHEPEVVESRRPFVRNARGGIQNWHWLVGLAVCGVLGFIALWVHAELAVQRIETLQREHKPLDELYWKLHFRHAEKPNWIEASEADPECQRAKAALLANERETIELVNSPNLLVRWKLRR